MGFSVGALIFRIGFWGFLIMIIVYYTPKPYSQYSGPHIRFWVTPSNRSPPKAFPTRKDPARPPGYYQEERGIKIQELEELDTNFN